MSAQLTELAAQIECAARTSARRRVAGAIAPLTEPFVVELRRALHKVVGHQADVIAVELINGLRADLIEQVTPIAAQQALNDITERLTTEAAA